MIGFPFDSHVTYDENGTPHYDRAISSAPYRTLLKKLFNTGVLPTKSDNMQVVAGEGMSVIVNAGFAVLEGCMKLEEEDKTLLVQASDSSDRIDTVVLRLDNNDDVRSCEYYVVKGQPATNPIRPELTRNASVYEIGLADVFIPANSSVISDYRITDTRLDSERCGIMSSISEFDTTTLYNQIESDLNTFRNDYENDFATWSEKEKKEFLDWFATVKDILDESTAGKLQNEIDDLYNRLDNLKLVHIAVSYDPSLAGANITATNGDETYTAEADLSGLTVFDGMSLGEWTISEDNYGTSSSVFTTFYGDYATAIGGDIFITINYPNEFVGKTITLSKDSKKYTRKATATGSVLFVVADTGTWVASAVIDSKTYTTSVNATDSGQYTATLSIGMDIAEWLSKAGISKSYSNLEEVLEDESTVRILFTKHDSVEYLVSNASDTDTLTTILSNDLCAKWINLRDYALDTLYASCKDIMDSADKYFYGEWVEKDGIWQPKGCVPIMTSNNAPYGNVTESSYVGADRGWLAFDGIKETASTRDRWETSVKSDAWVCYEFVNPIELKMISFEMLFTESYKSIGTYKIQWSDTRDTDDWHDASEVLTAPDTKETITAIIDTVGYHKYWRFFALTSGNSITSITLLSLQFYGRTLSVSSNDVGTLPPQTDTKAIINGVTYWLDYSEHEERHYIYDHRVEVESVTKTTTSILADVETTPYRLLRATDDTNAQTTDKIQCGSANAIVNGLPYNNYLDISSVNGNNATGFSTLKSNNFENVAFWLE